MPVGEGRETATPASREWARKENLGRLVIEWKKCNDWGTGIVMVGAVVSGLNSLLCS